MFSGVFGLDCTAKIEQKIQNRIATSFVAYPADEDLSNEEGVPNDES